MEWKRRIVALVQIKQAIDDLDTKRIWTYTLPRIGATQDELLSVEKHLGEPLDPRYREFLTYVGGWPAFYQTVDLFGPADLIGSMLFNRATSLLAEVDAKSLDHSRLRREDVLPIAASIVEVDLFVIAKRTAPQPGVVIWLAGHEVDRFPTFDEYFLAMMDFNRAEIQTLQRDK